MQDFPPQVTDPGAPSAQATGRRWRTRTFVDPDTRSPSRFLFWLLRQQPLVLIICSLSSMLEWLPGAVGPYVVGKVVDEGVVPKDLEAVMSYSLIMLGLALIGIFAGLLNHTFTVRAWLIGMYGPMKMITRKAAQLGHVLPQRTPTGEVLSVSASDSDEFGELTEIVSRACGAVISYLVIAGLVLSTSPKLGLVVLVAAPLVVLLATPLLRPLQRREEIERSLSSELTSMATDIVAGLRILRGIGGEQTFSRNYDGQSQRTRFAGVSAGGWQAAVEATGVLFSGLFLVALTWLGARQVVIGALSVGELISFFGYAVFMVWPIQTMFELAHKWVRSLVSAGKTIAVVELQPPWQRPQIALTLSGHQPLHDQVSGFTARPGQLTVIVSSVPDDSAALADRLGRYLPADTEPVSAAEVDGLKGRVARRTRARQRADRERLAARDHALADRRWGVTLGDVDLADAELAEVRRTIVVSDASSQLFSGTLQEAIDPHGRLTVEQAEAVLHAAAAEDVFDGLPDGWQGMIDERGRGLSGGQRQRVVLARVLALDPEILIMVEPTSAVDAHTEARIAERLSDYRRGRTTIITTVSPLILHHADQVALMRDRRIIAYGTHEELLRENASYRRAVVRSMEETEEVGSND